MLCLSGRRRAAARRRMPNLASIFYRLMGSLIRGECVIVSIKAHSFSARWNIFTHDFSSFPAARFVIYRFAFTRSREAKFASCGAASTVPAWKCTHICVAVNEIKVVKTINAEIVPFLIRGEHKTKHAGRLHTQRRPSRRPAGKAERKR